MSKFNIKSRFEIFSVKTGYLLKEFALLKKAKKSHSLKCKIVRGVGTVASLTTTGVIIAITDGVGAIVGRTVGALIGTVIVDRIIEGFDERDTVQCVTKINRLLDSFECEIAAMEPIIDFIARAFENDEAKTVSLQGMRAKVELLFQKSKTKASKTDEGIVCQLIEQISKVIEFKNEIAASSAIIEKVYNVLSEMAKVMLKNNGTEICDQICKIAPYLLACASMIFAIWTFKRCMREHITIEMIDDIVYYLSEIRNEYEHISDLLDIVPSQAESARCVTAQVNYNFRRNSYSRSELTCTETSNDFHDSTT